MRLELADSSIPTVAIAPGLTYSPGMRAIVSEDHLNRVAANYPGGRIGEPEDIVALANFLCSDAASHLSGTVPVIRWLGWARRPAAEGHRMRFGLVGTGYWARSAHVPALAASAADGIEFTSVWGRNPAAAAELAAGYRATPCQDFGSFLVSVGRGRLRGAAGRAGAAGHPGGRAGKHLLLEKPIALTGPDTDERATAVSQAQVASVVFFTARFQPDVRAWLDDVAAAGAAPPDRCHVWRAGGGELPGMAENGTATVRQLRETARAVLGARRASELSAALQERVGQLDQVAAGAEAGADHVRPRPSAPPGPASLSARNMAA